MVFSPSVLWNAWFRFSFLVWLFMVNKLGTVSAPGCNIDYYFEILKDYRDTSPFQKEGHRSHFFEVRQFYERRRGRLKKLDKSRGTLRMKAE
jgi:hypothetical protein